VCQSLHETVTTHGYTCIGRAGDTTLAGCLWWRNLADPHGHLGALSPSPNTGRRCGWESSAVVSDECLCSSKRSDFTKAGSPRICGVAACVARLTRGRACIHNLVIYMDDAPRSWQSKQTRMRSWIYCRMSSSSCAGVKAWTVLEDKQTACCHLYDRCQCLRLIWNCILVQATTQAPILNAIIKAGAFSVFGL